MKKRKKLAQAFFISKEKSGRHAMKTSWLVYNALRIGFSVFFLCAMTMTDLRGATKAASENHQYGGTLKIISSSSVVNLGAPWDTRASLDVIYISPAIETLVRYDEKGFVMPWLAKSFKADPASKFVTFKLRKGMKN